HPYHQFLDVRPFDVQQVADAGDVAVGPYDIDRAVAAIESAARSLVAGGTKVVALGGDHTVALPLLRAAAAAHGPLAARHCAAHRDPWDPCRGAGVWQGSPFRRAAGEGLRDLDHCQHVGVRGGIYDPSELADDRRAGFEIIDSEAF